MFLTPEGQLLPSTNRSVVRKRMENKNNIINIVILSRIQTTGRVVASYGKSFLYLAAFLFNDSARIWRKKSIMSVAEFLIETH